MISRGPFQPLLFCDSVIVPVVQQNYAEKSQGNRWRNFLVEAGRPITCSPINSYENPTSSSHFYLNWQWINCLGLSSFNNLKEKNDKTLMVLILGTEQSIIIKNKWQTWSWQSVTQRKVESLKKISLLNFSSTTWVSAVMDSISDSLP